MSEFVALTSLGPPGSMVAGYRRGDPVPAAVVKNWGLVDGEDVTSGDLDPDAANTAPTGRPGETGTRADWEAYAVANGMDPEHAREVSQDELEAVEENAERVGPERPADSARKSEWVAYVKARGGDPDWADADGTTKADLQAWEPVVDDELPAPDEGDPVAVDANARANG
jgi:hypothetical protein